MIICNHATIILLSIICACRGHPVENDGGLTLIDRITETETKIDELRKENAELRQHEVSMESKIRKLKNGQHTSKVMSEYRNH